MYATPFTPSTFSTTSSPLYLSHGSRDRAQDCDRAYSGRKRPRSDYFSVRPSLQSRTSSDRSQYHQEVAHSDHPADSNSNTSFASPTPLANSQYRCRNGLDTPGVAYFESTITPTGADTGTNAIFRRGLDGSTLSSDNLRFQPQPPSALSRERNGVPRTRRRTRMGANQSNSGETWTSFAWRLATGAAGAVWNFCGNGFAGFQAGGGQAYTFENGQVQQTKRQKNGGSSTPIPGDWPSDPEYVEISRHDASAERPAKRRQVTQDEWVLVNNQQRPSPAPLQVQGAYTTALQPRACSSVRRSITPNSTSKSLLPRPSTQRRTSRAASSAPRSSSVSYVPSLPCGSPAQRSLRQASFAPMRSPHSSPQRRTSQLSQENGSTGHLTPHTSTSPPKPRRSPGAHKQNPASCDINDPYTTQRASTPISAEAISKYRKRRDKDEKKQDAYMRKMNKQLQDLIKEGQAALASTIEVGSEMDASDGFGDTDFSGDSGVEMGFEEEERLMGRERGKRGHGRGVSVATLGARS